MADPHSTTANDPVISGVPFPVTRPDGTAVQTVAEFVGDTTFLVHEAVRQREVSGTGVLDVSATSVRFYQKDPQHEFRDVRVWRLEAGGDGFTARHDAAI